MKVFFFVVLGQVLWGNKFIAAIPCYRYIGILGFYQISEGPHETKQFTHEIPFTYQGSFTFFGLVNELYLLSLQVGKTIMTKNPKKEVLGMSTMSHKFQITIPKRVRERHGLKEGDTIVFVDECDRTYITTSTNL